MVHWSICDFSITHLNFNRVLFYNLYLSPNGNIYMVQEQHQANQRKSPTELDSNQAQSTMAGLNNPGGRGSPPVRNSPQGQRQMGMLYFYVIFL